MEEQQKSSNSVQWIAIAIIVAALIISGAVLYTNPKSNTGNNTGNNNTGTQPVVVDASKVKTAGVPFVGNANAKVIIAYWSDYQCPFCKRFDEDAIKNAYNEYVVTGKAKIVFKDYSFLGADSITAGLAARAVWELYPDKFYQWHVAMFTKQDNENAGWGKKADILALISSLGMDASKVDQLMTSKAAEYQKAMDADKAEGTAFGINGTPGTIVGKQMISGAQPYATLKAAIDAVK